jgi:hypothetical protein
LLLPKFAIATKFLIDYFFCFDVMAWLKIETAPFDRDLELAVIDFYGPHTVAFPCRRVVDGWIAATGAPVKISPTHWREWEKK